MKNSIARIYKGLVLLVVSLTAPVVLALNNDVKLGSPSDGPLAKVGKLMQAVVDFLGGAGTMFVVFVGLVIAWAMWVIVPKASGQAIGFIARAVSGGVLIFNIALFFTWMQSF